MSCGVSLDREYRRVLFFFENAYAVIYWILLDIMLTLSAEF